MSFDQRPQKIRVVADGKKSRAAESSGVAAGAGTGTGTGAGGGGGEGGSARSPSASTRDAGPVKGIRAIKGESANGSARAQGDLEAATGAAGASMDALGDSRSARGGWIIAAVVFVLGSAVGGAAAMAAFFH